jgi:hypothetical protein
MTLECLELNTSQDGKIYISEWLELKELYLLFYNLGKRCELLWYLYYYTSFLMVERLLSLTKLSCSKKNKSRKIIRR